MYTSLQTIARYTIYGPKLGWNWTVTGIVWVTITRERILWEPSRISNDDLQSRRLHNGTTAFACRGRWKKVSQIMSHRSSQDSLLSCCSDVQRQTAVTAHFSSEQLLLFTFALQYSQCNSGEALRQLSYSLASCDQPHQKTYIVCSDTIFNKNNQRGQQDSAH